MSVKTDPASAEIPSAEVFVPAAILDPDFPGLRAAPGQPLSCVQSVLSGQPDPSGSSVPCAQSVPCDQSVPGDISVASGQPVTPGLPAVSVRPVSPAQGAIAGRPPCPGTGRSARMEPGRPGLFPPSRVCPLRSAHSRWRSIPSSSCNPSTGRITVCWRLLRPGASGV